MFLKSLRNDVKTYYVHETGTPNTFLVNQVASGSVHQHDTAYPMNAAIEYYKTKTGALSVTYESERAPFRALYVTVKPSPRGNK